jgi:hypothetical protein
VLQALERAERLIGETGALVYDPEMQRLRLSLGGLTADPR